MSEFEALQAMILTAMDSVNDNGRAVNRYAEVVNEQVAALWKDNAELRDELYAVANRLEALTRAVTTSPAEVAAAIVNDANHSTLKIAGRPGEIVSCESCCGSGSVPSGGACPKCAGFGRVVA